jgi:anthranilate synthase/aminodeoxychorismate synthase-like glutamine amidotransferase
MDGDRVQGRSFDEGFEDSGREKLMNVLVLDNYDSFVYNIVQYVGELGAKPFTYRSNQVNLNQIQEITPERIIISPGPGTPENTQYFGNSLTILKDSNLSIPILGICLGHQGIIHAFGGRIVHARRLMHGKNSQIKHDGKSIFEGVKNPFSATRYHSLVGERDTFPSCLSITAEALDDGEIMGVRHRDYPIEGVQFHPESIMTEDGKKILKNFLDHGVRN